MFFNSWNLSMRAISPHFWQGKYCKLLVNHGPFVAICSSVSLNKQHFGSRLELLVKWIFHFPECPLSSLVGFCLLSPVLLWINSFCYWTFKSCSKYCISDTILGDLHVLVHKLMAATLLDCFPAVGIFFPIYHLCIILIWCCALLLIDPSLSSLW